MTHPVYQLLDHAQVCDLVLEPAREDFHGQYEDDLDPLVMFNKCPIISPLRLFLRKMSNIN